MRIICNAGAAALDDYERHCRDAAFAPAQSPQWVRLWARHCNPDVVVAALWIGERRAMQVALEVAASGPLRVARFPGGSHANGNFPAISNDTGAAIAPEHARRLLGAIGAARPDIDLVLLERHAPELAGLTNPFAGLPHEQSPDPALAVDLAGGFEAVLSRASGKRKRKKHRSQTRKFEAAGGFRRIVARSRAETDHLLSAFFAMKAARFSEKGIRNVFAENGVQDFFRDLFGAEAVSGAPRFVLHGLEVGGKLRAITGSSVADDRIICEFGAIAEDELAFASPGEFLFHENIRDAAEQGLAIYDFGVGDEAYKRLWCDLEIAYFDLRFPLTAKGRMAAFLLGGAGRAKRAIKSNPLLWNAFKRLRRARATAAAPSDE